MVGYGKIFLGTVWQARVREGKLWYGFNFKMKKTINRKYLDDLVLDSRHSIRIGYSLNRCTGDRSYFIHIQRNYALEPEKHYIDESEVSYYEKLLKRKLKERIKHKEEILQEGKI